MLKLGAKEKARSIAEAYLPRNLNKNSKVAIIGSNYRVFERHKPSSECIKCADSLIIRQPDEKDCLVFETSLCMRDILKGKGVEYRLILMPADLHGYPKKIRRFRDEYELPKAFGESLKMHGVSEDEFLAKEVRQGDGSRQTYKIVFESLFKSRAVNILKKVVREEPWRIVEEVDAIKYRTNLALMFQDEPWPVSVPIAKFVPAGKGMKMAPLCQIICSAIHEWIGSERFTHTVWVSTGEALCINYGTLVAHSLGYLKAKTSIISVDEMGTPLGYVMHYPLGNSAPCLYLKLGRGKKCHEE